MSTVKAPKQLQRRAALARLEAEELADTVARERSALGLAPWSQAELERMFDRLERLAARIQAALDLPVGITVKQAADRLDVTEPTVRKWMSEGLLQQMKGRKPVEITQRSVIDVEHILDQVRKAYPARRWSEALAAFLHDRDLLGQKWATEGIEQFQRGELVER